MENYLGEFTAIGDDGLSYRINIYHPQHPSEHDAGAATPDAASMVLRTMIGQLLTRSAKGMYRIRETGLRLRSAAANAP